jgi:hypothetical protein
VEATAIVTTRYPQLGNGFEFIDMSPKDRLKLADVLMELAQQGQKN